MNRPLAPHRWSTPRAGRLCFWLPALCAITFNVVAVSAIALCGSARAQDANTLSVDDEPVPDASTPAGSTQAPVSSIPDSPVLSTPDAEIPAITPTPIFPIAAPETGAFGRTIVVMLGGLSWREWSRLSAASSTATPALRHVLEEGALGAAWLPGENKAARLEYSRRGKSDEGVSDAMLRAAAILSSGQKISPAFSSSASASAQASLPRSLAQMLGIGELLSRDAGVWENSTAGAAFARRGGRRGQVGNLVNLGWGEWSRLAQSDNGDGSQLRPGVLPVGALGWVVHSVGGKTAAIGNGETDLEIGRGRRLRETALIAVDENGMVDAGEVSSSVLARDNGAPFGIRANGKASLLALDRVFADPQTALVALEWGDLRRAARYEILCAPDVAAANRQIALGRLDVFIGEVVTRMTKPNDRLILICVPELDAPGSQLLPVVFWRPFRGGQGAILTSGQSETLGMIGLENIHAKIVAQLNAKADAEYSTTALPIQETGAPSPSARRIGKLLALQSGLDWLSQARPFAHALWCVLFIGAAALSLWALHFPGARVKSLARIAWSAAMIFPLLLWLAGLCVETTWRFGTDGGAAWKLSLALLLVACLMWFLVGATFKWFSRARLLGTRIAFSWLLLSVFSLWVGAFALPLNGLLQRAATDASSPSPRAGDIWALLLISATLLGIAGLTRVTAANPNASNPNDATPATVQPETLNPEPETVVRRAINLRPASLWAIAIIAILGLANWGANPLAATIAFVGVGAMMLRLWLERAAREHRLRVRRVAVALVVASGVLLMWQRGGAPLAWSTLSSWWPGWAASWSEGWWNAAFVAALLLAIGCLLPRPRQTLRAYLNPRFSRRAMLGGAALASASGVLLIGPSAAPLLATFTLGAVIYEALR